MLSSRIYYRVGFGGAIKNRSGAYCQVYPPQPRLSLGIVSHCKRCHAITPAWFYCRRSSLLHPRLHSATPRRFHPPARIRIISHGQVDITIVYDLHYIQIINARFVHIIIQLQNCPSTTESEYAWDFITIL